MKDNDTYTIRIEKISNGFLVSAASSQGYKTAWTPQTFVKDMAEVETGLPSLLATAVALEIDESAGPDF